MAAVNAQAAAIAAADFAIDYVMQGLAIRDTTSHASAASDCRGYKSKMLWVTYNLNQGATLVLEGSNDGVTFITLATQAVAANFGLGAMTQNGGGGLGTQAVLGDCYAFLRARIACGTAPTSGTVDVWLHKQAT